jgi:hypothetical protein
VPKDQHTDCLADQLPVRRVERIKGLQWGKPILGFVFGEKGLIGDLSLEGTKISKIKD